MDQPTINGFSILHLIHQGSQSDVFLAYQMSMDRVVALKVLKQHDTESIQRFMREAKILAGLTHPNLIHVYDIFKHKETYILVMEFVEGKTLKKLVEEKGAFDEADIIDTVEQVLRALDYAHKQGILHRDIKPDNLILDRSGLVRLADLGLARITRGAKTITSIDTVIGTPAYMPPEQLENSHLANERSDYYSLGATIYFLATSQDPYQGDNPIDILSQLAKDPPQDIKTLNPQTTTKIRNLVCKLMQRDPRNRPRTISEIKEHLYNNQNKTKHKIKFYVLSTLVIIATVLTVLFFPEKTTDNTPLPINKQSVAYRVRESTAQNLLQQAKNSQGYEFKLDKLKTIIENYPNTSVINEAKRLKSSIINNWNITTQKKYHRLKKTFDASLKSNEFNKAKSAFISTSLFKTANPWWSKNKNDALKKMEQELVSKINTFRTEKLQKIKTLMSEKKYLAAQEISEILLLLIPGDQDIEQIQKILDNEKLKYIHNIKIFKEDIFTLLCRKKDWSKINFYLDDFKSNSFFPLYQKSLQKHITYGTALNQVNQSLKTIFINKVGQSITIEGKNNKKLTGTIALSIKGQPTLHVTNNYEIPIIETLTGNKSIKSLEQAFQNDPTKLFYLSIWAKYACFDSKEAERLLSKAIDCGLSEKEYGNYFREENAID